MLENDEKKEVTYEEIKPLLREAAKVNFVAFCYYWDWEFFRKRHPLKKVCVALQRIADGEIKKLSISMPPRSGKSYIVSLFAAWILGRFPEDSVMRNCCTAKLYNKFSYDTRGFIKDERFKEVFPDIEMSKDKANVEGWNTNKARQVSYFGAGVGGTIIGFGATKVAITDDLFKDMTAALSETIVDSTHEWKESAHDSRKETGCAEVDVGTRWTRDDVIGKNEAEGWYDEQIIVPAMVEKQNDESVMEWVSFCEAIMTTEEYLEKKGKTRKEIWAAEYMQKPVDIKGRLFEHLLHFRNRAAVLERSEGALAYIDVADEGKDFLCMTVGHVVGLSIFITDVIYTQRNTDHTIPACADLLDKYDIKHCRVETNNMGGVFIKQLRKKLRGKVEGTEKRACKLYGINNSTNKATRIFMNSSYVLRKFHFLDTDQGEYGEFLAAMRSYRHNGTNTNDDAPDSSTGLALMFEGFMPHLDK